jgi:hypothetical protein
MNNFITGVLTRNKEGATYEDVVYDRRLTLHLPNGYDLSIFDPADPISSQLQIGEVYTMVLSPLVMSVNLISTSQPSSAPEMPTNANNWQGTVIDSDWKAPKDAFRLTHPELYELGWVLLATPLGNVIINPDNAGTSLSVGMTAQWENTRLDLYAVV